MIKTVSTFLLVSLLATTALAQEAPAPRRMPRTPVSRQMLVAPRDPMPASRELQGPAAIIDGEKLRIGETDLRLFGVVPPQLAASFGPQARAELDTLAGGQNVSCQIRDRDRDGRLLATCRNAGGSDMALSLLKRGLAVTARGSLAGTELAAAYSAAEQAAQSQKIGLWSVPASAPAVPASVAAAPAPAPQSVKQETAALVIEAPVKKEEKVAARADAQTQAKIAADILSQQAQARIDDASWAAGENAGFFERYQILISGFLMLATALCIVGALGMQKIRDRREEIRALAAALRGELMAARSVCHGRAKSITGDAEDHIAVWPRIRSTLYQAYVGRLGLLGAELARRVASVYGQSSDYAALYNPASGVTLEVPKKQALQALVKRIDEVLPKLAEVERTGRISAPAPASRLRAESALSPSSASDSAAAQDTVAETEASPAVPQSTAALQAAIAVWESVLHFIKGDRGAATPLPAPLPPDPNAANYAAIIEADMARYQYEENIEPLDTSTKRKRG